jgi:sialate O-acetylesterase
VPSNILKPKHNILVVRVFDTGGRGGMYSGAIWGNPVLLGKWLYKPDYKIDAMHFPKPHVVNVSPFSSPSILYNGNIAPITSLSVKGIIWYQGESNAGRAYEYRELFPAMINDWRAKFKQGNIPFLFVQLANYMQEKPLPEESEWAELREAQTLALQLPRTGMAVIIDIGEALDIHPKNKKDVGIRLAKIALSDTYGQLAVAAKSPVYKSLEIDREKAVLSFDNNPDGLIIKGNSIMGLYIAGADHHFYPAQAIAKDNRLTGWSKSVAHPVAVRYAFSNTAAGNLFSKEGMPVAPFRTDAWEVDTSGE